MANFYQRDSHERLLRSLENSASIPRVDPTGILKEYNMETIGSIFGRDVESRARGNRYPLAGVRQIVKVSSSEELTALFWETCCGTLLNEGMLAAAWYRILGSVRDQEQHGLCWAYAATDLTSAMLMSRDITPEHVRLSVWSLVRRVRPDLLSMQSNGHSCYGVYVDQALQFVKSSGVCAEIPGETEREVLFCNRDLPSNRGPLYPINIGSISVFGWLEQALAHFHDHPIAADLTVYPELWLPGFNIYRGPTSPRSTLTGYHSVIIAEVTHIHNEPVAICKLSNGLGVGVGGYVFVSLSIMYMIVGASVRRESSIRHTPEPAHLLSHFVILDIVDKKRDQGETSKAKAAYSQGDIILNMPPQNSDTSQFEDYLAFDPRVDDKALVSNPPTDDLDSYAGQGEPEAMVYREPTTYDNLLASNKVVAEMNKTSITPKEDGARSHVKCSFELGKIPDVNDPRR